MQSLILSGVTLNDLLSRIEQLLDSKIGVQHHKQTKQQSDYLSRKDVASLLKITLPTLHDWTKLGYLTAYKMGTRVLYKESEIIETLEKAPSFKYRKGGLNLA